jgi:hypothetical protein
MGFLHVCTLYIVHCFTSFYLSLFCLFRRLIMYLAVCLYRSFLSKSIYLSFPNICKDFAVAGSSLCPGPGVDQADLPVDYSPSYPLWIARYVQYLHLGCTIVKVHCTLYIVHCSLYIVHCTLCIVHCALCIVHCTCTITLTEGGGS